MRAYLLAALTLAVTFAGCVADPAQDDLTLPDVEELAFLPSVDLICPDTPISALQDVAHQRDCAGFGEPVMEVAGDGTVWYSATCCVGRSPPIWVSRDGGETFETLPFADGTGLLRDGTGIEGDFAIDDAGNVYFFDILAATAYLTKFEADGTHVHTKPDAFPPLVDRPWIRAGAEDEVFILYNTGSTTRFYRSDDGGLTWDHAGATAFPCPLMALGQGWDRDLLMVGGCPGEPRVYVSRDGGTDWGEVALPLPEGRFEERRMPFYMQPAADESGRIYVPYTHTVADTKQTAVYVSIIETDGTVRGPYQATDPGLHDKPWLVAGKDGSVAFANYRSDGDADSEDDAVWYLDITYSTDADGVPTWTTVRGDSEPVHEGALGRSLGDFLQARLGPDGAIAVAYASDLEGSLVNRFVRSDGVDLGPAVFLNGPQP